MNNRLFLGILLQLALVPSWSLAQSAACTYQGRLLDRGQPANGSYDLRFALANAATNGDYVGGTLTNAPVLVSNGLFVVTLDFGAGVFEGSARWLEIGARTNGSTTPYTLLYPRQAVTAAPYATFATAAANAAVAGGLTAGASITVNGEGVTNLNGAYIQPGTINSNKLDAATAAQLALAGTGVRASTSGASLSNLTVDVATVFNGTNSVFVTGAGTALANGNYTNAGINPNLGYYMTNAVTGAVLVSDVNQIIGAGWVFLDSFNVGNVLYVNNNPASPIGGWTNVIGFTIGTNPPPTVVYGGISEALTVNGGLLANGNLAVNGNLTLAGNLSFANPLTGNGAGLTNVIVSWANGVASKPLQFTVVPGQQRPHKAMVGWNSWYDMGWNISGAGLTNVMNDFTSWGLKDAGYVWLGVDNGWQNSTRDAATHRLVPNAFAFPQDMSALSSNVHSRGFKLGLYTSGAYCGDANYPALAPYPVQDAQAMFTWGVDELKFDGVGSASWMSTFYNTVQNLCLSNGQATLFIETYCTPTDGYGVYQDPRLALWANAQLPSRDWATSPLAFMNGFYAEGINHAYYATFVPALGYLVNTNWYVGTDPTNHANVTKSMMTALAMLSGDLVAQAFNRSGGKTTLEAPTPAQLAAMVNTNVIGLDQDAAQVTGWPISYINGVQTWIKPLSSATGPEWAVAVCNVNATDTRVNYFSMTNIPAIFTGPWRAVELWGLTTQVVADVIVTTNAPWEPKLFRLTPYSGRKTPIG